MYVFYTSIIGRDVETILVYNVYSLGENFFRAINYTYYECVCSDYKMIIQYWTAEGKSKKRKTVWDRSTYI